MKQQKQPLFILATYITTIISALLFYGYKLTSSNIYNQVPAIISLLNPELYNEDFYIQEMTQFTPRYYYYYLIYWGVKLGISLPMTCFILYFIAFSSFLIGLYSVGSIFNKSRYPATVFAFLGFTATVNGRIGHADLFRIDPIPATLAMGLVVWGFYFCFRKKWILGYLFFGLTCFLQFLVGALPGVLMAIPLFISAKKNKKFQQIFFSFGSLGICVCLIYIPMLLSGNTNSGSLSNEEFVSLYGFLRHPHHLVFSAFGLGGSRGWLNFILFTVGGLLCINSSKSLKKEIKFQLFTVVIVSCCLLLINYIFVELYPLNFIAKLQFARVTPFSQLMILLGISVLVKEECLKGKFPLVCLLIIAPILKGAGILLFILGCGLWLERRYKRLILYPINIIIFSWGLISLSFLAIAYQKSLFIGLFILSIFSIFVLAWHYQRKYLDKIARNSLVKLLSFGVLLFLMPFEFFPDGIIIDLFFLLWWGAKNNKAIAKNMKSISIILFIVFMILYKHYDLCLLGAIAFPLFLDSFISRVELKKIITFSLAILLSIYFSFSLLGILPAGVSSFFRDRIKINAVAQSDIAILAQKFQQLSSEDALVLVPPLDEQFRFYSERAVVFTFKSFPFTDQGIKIWRDRLETISGNKYSGKYNLNDVYRQHSNSAIIDIAKQFKADYILTRLDWHQNLDGLIVAQQGDWVIYQLEPVIN